MHDLVKQMRDRKIYLLFTKFTTCVDYQLAQMKSVYNSKEENMEIQVLDLNNTDGPSKLGEEVSQSVNKIIASDFM